MAVHLSGWPAVKFLVTTQFDNLTKVGKIKVPKLIIHSRDDEIVPFDMGERLYQAAPEPKQFLELRGSHNTAFFDSGPRYTSGIKDFIDLELGHSR